MADGADRAEGVQLPRVQRRVLVGTGAFGSVYKGVDELTGRMVAVKVLHVTSSAGGQTEAAVMREIAVMRGLPPHPNIVRYIGAELCGGGVAGEQLPGNGVAPAAPRGVLIWMEYVAGGSLLALLHEYGALTEQMAARYARQVAAGLAFLHSHRIVHRDVKGANLLVTPDGTVKLADFGHARELLRTMADTVVGTACFMAPEVVKGTGHDESSDVWSFGCTVVEMLLGRPPFSRFGTPWAALFHVAGLAAFPGDELPPDATPACRALLLRCLSVDPAARPSAAELSGHTWLGTSEDVPR